MLLDLDTLEKRRQYLILKFAKTGIKVGTLSDLFQSIDKTNKKQTRDDAVYMVKFANTNRLKHSFIVTMQNMLNEDAYKTSTPFIFKPIVFKN